jgi:hypothetical protein
VRGRDSLSSVSMQPPGAVVPAPCTGHILPAGVPLDVRVDDVEGIHAGVPAVVLNVTVTNTSAQIHVTVHPAGQALPTVSDLDWPAGKTVHNLTVATVGTGGQIGADNFAGNTDVTAWFS